MNSSSKPPPRRPALLGPAALDTFGWGDDPATVTEAAHESAAALVRAGRQSTDPAVTARLLALVDEYGLDLLADLWAAAPARSLPGALWRLYLIREWVQRDGLGAAQHFAAGKPAAEVSAVVAGAAEPSGVREVQQLADAVLTGVYRGDLDVALERAAAFCRVVAAGRAAHAPASDAAAGPRPGAPLVGSGADPGVMLRQAAALLDTAADLDAAARAWRAQDFH